eukprot:TRINITY_DN2324_c0_g1_i1.p1 TRINITY_DN2324_c0_g1~~TRINITY_DN2324_c0_g1_i1.p1  ORF type:complete len:348 (-),score=31.21 TRINITY_DN2324_c0_g1_i1:1030-2073(-)
MTSRGGCIQITQTGRRHRVRVRASQRSCRRRARVERILGNSDIWQLLLSSQDGPAAGDLTVDGVAALGHLSLLQAMHRTPTPEGLKQAAATGHLDVVEWLAQHRQEGASKSAMDAAAEHGHLAVVKWLHENRTEGCSTAAMDLAAANNHLEVLQWLHNNRKEGCTSDAFHFAAIYGHLQIIQWLHHNNLVQSAAHGEIDALELAAEHGHLTVVQWLLDHGYGGQKSLELAMRFAAANGHVRIVEFLHKQEGQPLQPEDFLVASSNGQLEVVMYSWQHCDWRHNMTSTCGSSGSAALDVLDAALEQVGHIYLSDMKSYSRLSRCAPSAFISYHRQGSCIMIQVRELMI